MICCCWLFSLVGNFFLLFVRQRIDFSYSEIVRVKIIVSHLRALNLDVWRRRRTGEWILWKYSSIHNYGNSCNGKRTLTAQRKRITAKQDRLMCTAVLGIFGECASFSPTTYNICNRILTQLLTVTWIWHCLCTWYIFFLMLPTCSIRWNIRTCTMHTATHNTDMNIYVCQCNTFRLHRHVCVLRPISNREE